MNLSVIIPTMHRSEDLRRCLGALKAQARPADEVIVVIGPGDAAAMRVFAEVAAGTAGWRALPAPRPSVVEALNLGLGLARGDIIVLTDDDAEAPPVWLARIEQWFLRDEKIGAVGGRDHQLVPARPEVANPPLARRVGQFNGYGLLIGNHHCGARQSPLQVDVIKGVNFAFRRAAFGPMAIDGYLISRGAEVGWELDICQTIRRANWRLIYDNDVFVHHHIGPRIAGDDRENIASVGALRRVQNTAYLTAKYQPAWQMLLVSARMVLAGSRGQPGLLWGLLGLVTRRAALLPAAWKIAGAYGRGTRDGRAARRQNLSPLLA